VKFVTHVKGRGDAIYKSLGTSEIGYDNVAEGRAQGSYELANDPLCPLEQWYSTFFVRVPPDIISLQLCTPKVVGT
jgi:hypothetical protein